MVFGKCEYIFSVVTMTGGHDWYLVDGGQSFMCGGQDWIMNNYPAQIPAASCGEISSGIQTQRCVMILLLTQSSLVAELGFIHESEQEMCQESTLFYFCLPAMNNTTKKTKESICLTFENPAVFQRNPWILGLLYQQIRKEKEEKSVLHIEKPGSV